MPSPPIIIRAALSKNPDGTLRTTNPFGDFNPTPATLQVDLVAFRAAIGSFVGLQTGATPLSINLRGAWLTGSEAATCTFSIRSVSGDVYSTRNWTLTGSTLAQSLVTGSIGAGTLEFFAVDSGGNSLSLGQYSWSIIAAVATVDTQPPSIPTHLQVTGALNVLNCTIDAASDRVNNGVPPSGMKQYNVFVDGVFNEAVTASQGPSPVFVATSIGNSLPAASLTDTAGVVTLNAAGVGVHNVAAEECLFYGAPMTGDGFLIVKCDAFASANQFSTSGIMIRETLAQGAIFGCVYLQPGTLGFQAKRRATTGGVGTNVASASGVANGWCKLTRAGANVTASYSVDGNTWTDIATMALPMNNTAQWGLFLSSQSAGASITSTIREVNLNTVSLISFAVNTSGTHTVTVSSQDKNNNISAVCAGVSGTATAAATTGSVKFHHGLYIYTDRNQNNDTQLARMTGYFAGKPAVVGSQLISFWAQWENPNTPGDYSGNWASAGTAGFQLMDKILAAHASRGLYFMWHISTYGFGGSNRPAVFDSSVAPTYLGQAAYGANNNVEATGLCGGEWVNTTTQTTKTKANVKAFTRWWDSAVMDRMLAMSQAYGLRYDNPNPALNAPNSQFLEMVSFIGESAIPTYTGYSDAAGLAQLQRYIPTVRGHWPTTQCRLWGSYFSDDTVAKPIIDLMAKYYWAGGGPDCVNETGTGARPFPFNKAWRGINPTTSAVDPTYTNYVGLMPWVSEFEPDEEGPRTPGIGPAPFGTNNWIDYINGSANLQHANYVTLFDNTFTGNNDKRLGGYVASQPSHPDGLDWFGSLFTGGTVGGATAGTTLPFAATRPGLLP